MPDAHGDDLIWTLGGREPHDPQRAARMADWREPTPVDWGKPCQRRTHHTNRLPFNEWTLTRMAAVAFLGLTLCALAGWAIWRIFA
tara:strand:+ start:46054 stop:46311 length:258 start_codon:yes stop_codon:yes gene_type:complete